jgi:hypothetical protein
MFFYPAFIYSSGAVTSYSNASGSSLFRQDINIRTSTKQLIKLPVKNKNHLK